MIIDHKLSIPTQMNVWMSKQDFFGQVQALYQFFGRGLGLLLHIRNI